MGNLIGANDHKNKVLGPTEQKTDVAVPSRGRRRDHARNADILGAALEMLAEVGYERMTMDMVVERAKAGKATAYRRWSSKAEMVLEAIGTMKQAQVVLETLPDTGSLRGDLLGLFKMQSADEDYRKLKIMGGLASMLAQNPELAEAGNAAIMEPWVAANRVLMQRAVARGELSILVDVETASHIIPSMAAYRALILHKSFDRELLVSLIDGVLLPTLSKVLPDTERPTWS